MWTKHSFSYPFGIINNCSYKFIVILSHFIKIEHMHFLRKYWIYRCSNKPKFLFIFIFNFILMICKLDKCLSFQKVVNDFIYINIFNVFYIMTFDFEIIDDFITVYIFNPKQI